MRPWMKWLLTGWREEQRPAPVALAMAPAADRIGICCSGGGIRSASFNLGALQALQAAGLMQRAKYLAAVSGGSYIAAAFCMVANTKGPEDSDRDVVTLENPPFAPGSPEEQYLRNHASYMAPDGMSMVYLVFRVLLGLTFNLVFLALPVAAGAGLLAMFAYEPPNYGFLTGADGSCTGAKDSSGCGLLADIKPWVWWTLGVIAASVVLFGLWSLLWRFRHSLVSLAAQTWTIRAMLALALATVVLVVVPVCIDLLYGGNDQPSTGPAVRDHPALPALGGGGLLALLAAVVLHVRGAVPEIEKGWRSLKSLPARVRMAVVYAVAAIVGPAIFLGIAVYTAAIMLASDRSDGSNRVLVLILLGAFGLIYAIVDLNTWSLHPFYRRRLCSAFALKRVKEGGRVVAVERDYDKPVVLSESRVDPGPGGKPWPTLLVCAAANVSDPGVSPPGRGVTSFTFTPDMIGGPLVKKIPASEYEQALGRNRRRDITLPAAVAVSGAAVSPSMGKLTRRPLRFLMALANVRLGVWLPNPRRIADWKRTEPPAVLQGLRKLRRSEQFRELPDDYRRWPRPSYLVRELLGRNRVDAKFLYVTDGGHYENLGLVELLRRGCMTVYCIDAGGGKGTKDLGDAIALARSELNVQVEISGAELVEAGIPPLAPRSVEVGTIRYPGVEDEGKLVYVRSVMTEGLSWDVVTFREDDPVFPHHSTMDQLYTDQKFEAYRALGHAAGEKAVAALGGQGEPAGPGAEAQL